MGKLISDRAWERYKRIVTQFLDEEAGKQPIIWAKKVVIPSTHGEDLNNFYYKKPMEALCYYNAFRNWPINQPSITGDLDNENLSIMVSKKQVETMGCLTEEGYFDFDWASDRFIINGITYRPSGDTQVAQAKDEAIVFLIILKRDRDAKINFITESEFEALYRKWQDPEGVLTALVNSNQ